MAKSLFSSLLPFGFIVIAIVIFVSLDPIPPTQITISTGREDGIYFRYALEYRTQLARHGIRLNLVPGAGSGETIERLRNDEVDVGFVQGGMFNVADDEDLRSLGSMFYEPIWVFYRTDAVSTDAGDTDAAGTDANGSSAALEGLSSLVGKRIGIGEDGSGTQPVALRLLTDNGITNINSELRALSNSEAVDALRNGTLDAAFFIIAPNADLIRTLMRHPDIELLDINRAEAYRRRIPFIGTLTITQGLIDLAENLPARDHTVLGITAKLIVREDIHPSLVRLLMRVATDIHSRPGLLEGYNEFPTEEFTEITLHSQAARFYREGSNWFEENFPFIIAASLDRLIVVAIPLITIYTLLQTIRPLLNLGVQSRALYWYRILRHVDRRLDRYTLEETEAEIARLKAIEKSVVHDFNLPSFYLPASITVRFHIRFMITRLEEHRTELLEAANAEIEAAKEAEEPETLIEVPAPALSPPSNGGRDSAPVR